MMINLQCLFERLKILGGRQEGNDHHEIIGWNFKFTDLQAVVGIEQMRKLPWRVQRMRRIFGLYYDRLSIIPGVRMVDRRPTRYSGVDSLVY